MADWMNVLEKIAPTLATAVLGPLGGAAIEVIGSALGLDDKTKESVQNALSGTTPEQLIALKKADEDFKIRVQELGLKQNELAFDFDKQDMQIAAGDRDSARKREMAVGDKTTRNLAYAITVGFFGVLFTTMFGHVDAGMKDVMNIMLGTLGTAWVSIIAYYFGSSAGSKAKTELLAKAEPIK